MESKKLFIFILCFIILINFVAACGEDQININNASIEDLDLIIWIGPVTAQGIVDARPFNSVGDLINVSGIGDTKLQNILDQGLACVNVESTGDEEEYEDLPVEAEESVEWVNEPVEERKDTDPEIINYIVERTPNRVNATELQVIHLNPKDINTENNTSKISKSGYSLMGLGIFSIIIISLLVFKIKKTNKNEFR